MENKFELAHLGINTPDPESALELAKLLSLVFNLNPRHGQKSEFAGEFFECGRRTWTPPWRSWGKRALLFGWRPRPIRRTAS